MFSFYQAKLTGKSLLQRVEDLLLYTNQTEDAQCIFVSLQFLESVKAQTSASALLLEREKNEAVEFLTKKLAPNKSLVFLEDEIVTVISGNDISFLESNDLLEIEGKKIAFSFDIDLSDFVEEADLNIIYNTEAYRLNFQKDLEENLQAFAKEVKTNVACLNSVYAEGGNLYHGQSSFFNDKGELVKRFNAFEAEGSTVDFTKTYENAPLTRDDFQEIFEAIVFGIREEVKESGLNKIVLGLSGGIDSALVAPLCVEALGKENVIGLLMPSPHSSDHSVSDAQLLANNLGMQSYILPLEDAMNAYHNPLLPIAQEHNATEHTTGLMLQNLQSRLRGVMVMSVSNALKAFVMGTGNKSEACMGYCTLYGDSCAALFPIGDLYKKDVYGLANWYNNYKGKEIIPHGSLTKEPSAELAPDQKDSDTLPIYPMLDAFLAEVLENGQDPFEVKHDFSIEERKDVLRKMRNAEFKRAQSAPIIKISKCTLGKDWT